MREGRWLTERCGLRVKVGDRETPGRGGGNAVDEEAEFPGIWVT